MAQTAKGKGEVPSQGGATGRYWYPEELVLRLRRVEGQARGLQALVARGAPCSELDTQLAAMQGALEVIRRIVDMCRVAEHLSRSVGPFDNEQVRQTLMALQHKDHIHPGV